MVINRRSEIKFMRWIAGAAVFNSITASFFDQQIIDKDIFYYYVGVQSISALICSFCLIFANKYLDFTKKTILLWCLTYAVICQFFIPFSFFTFIIATFFLLYFGEIDNKFFKIVLIIYSVLMVLAISFFPFYFGTSEESKTIAGAFQFASIYTVVLTTIIGLISNKLKERNKNNLDFVNTKLYNLGNQTGAIVHDLKGLLLPPINYLKLLDKKAFDEESKIIIKESSNSLEDIKRYVESINQIFSLKKDIEKLNSNTLIEDLSRVFRNKTQNVEFKTENFTFFTDINLIKSIYLNLLKNSLEAFSTSKTNIKQIEIVKKDNTVYFKDNAGGFTPEIIKKFQNDEYCSLKTQGSGFGLFLIKKSTEQLRAKIEIYNEGNKAVVAIEFPSNSFLDKE